MKEQVSEEIDSLKNRIIEISDTIHDEPELGYKEFKASELLTSELQKFGFVVEKGVAGLPTSFKATHEGTKRGIIVAILAEYDALPELGHACGHNIIAAAAVGAAMGLNKVMRDIKGTLIIFGTPAEEGYTENAGGKIVMLDEIKKSDVALMIHPGSRYRVGSTSLAREAFEISFQGQSSHAGASPEKGINALEGIILTFQGINSLRQHIPRDVRIHGIITEGGVSPNIVPDKASAILYVRAPNMQILDAIVKKVQDCARGASLATGAQVTFRNTANTYINRKPNRVLSKIAMQNLQLLGIDILDDATQVSGGSTDFGNVSQVIPAISVGISIGSNVVLHSPEATIATSSPEAHKALIIASKLLAYTAIDLFTDPSLKTKVKESFNEGT